MRFTIFENWWTLALRGALALLFGTAVVAWPGPTPDTFAQIFGAYAVAEGACNAVGAVRAARVGERRWPMLVEGLAGVAAGLLVPLVPGLTASALLLLVALWSLAKGVLELVAAARLRKVIRGERMLALSAVASVAFGVVLLVAPGAGVTAFAAWAGAYAFAFGGPLIALSLRLRALRPVALRTSARVLPGV